MKVVCSYTVCDYLIVMWGLAITQLNTSVLSLASKLRAMLVIMKEQLELMNVKYGTDEC